MITSAHKSGYPKAIKILGYISIIAAILLIIIGRAGFQNLVSSALPILIPFGRVVGIVVIALGGFLVIAFTGKKK